MWYDKRTERKKSKKRTVSVMENEKNQASELSIQKYAIARLLLYITLLVIIVFLFIPVIPHGEYS